MPGGMPFSGAIFKCIKYFFGQYKECQFMLLTNEL